MKTYYAADRIRFVGKGWEMKHWLNQLLKQSQNPNRPLSEWLSRFQ